MTTERKKQQDRERMQRKRAEDKVAVEIADAVLSWMVKYDLIDTELEYRDDDIIEVLNDLWSRKW